MCGSKFTNHYLQVFLNGGSDRPHDVVSLPCLLRIGVSQINSCFSLLNGFYDAINLVDTKYLIPICSINQRLLSLWLFSPGENGDEIPRLHHSKSGWGSGLVSGCTGTDG
jgi:hypothetical protein